VCSSRTRDGNDLISTYHGRRAATLIDVTIYDMHLRLGRLAAERHEAIEAGLGGDTAYMRDLELDLITARAAYVGLGITAIASLRGELFGRQIG
jgi:hypothetical protein